MLGRLSLLFFADAGSNLIRLRTGDRRQRHTAAPQGYGNSSREADQPEAPRLAGIEGVQVHHRGHCRRRNVERRTSHDLCHPECAIHHPRKKKSTTDEEFTAEQEERDRDKAIAQATGLRVLKSVRDTVPVRLTKRDVLFVAERLAAILDERRLAVVLRLHGIGKTNGAGDAPAKLLASSLRKADESTIGRILAAITVLHAAHSPNESAKVCEDRRVLQGGRGRDHGQGQARLDSKGKSASHPEGDGHSQAEPAAHGSY
jgi:hypothetical protein